MIDCFDGMLVSWSLGTRPDAELLKTMLDAAIETVVDTEDRPRRSLRSWCPLSLARLALAHR